MGYPPQITRFFFTILLLGNSSLLVILGRGSASFPETRTTGKVNTSKAIETQQDAIDDYATQNPQNRFSFTMPFPPRFLLSFSARPRELFFHNSSIVATRKKTTTKAESVHIVGCGVGCERGSGVMGITSSHMLSSLSFHHPPNGCDSSKVTPENQHHQLSASNSNDKKRKNVLRNSRSRGNNSESGFVYNKIL